MRVYTKSRWLAAAMLASLALTGGVLAHGNVTPQVVDTAALPEVGDAWLKLNPYRGNARAIAVGESAYGNNCAHCHGLQVISGGIAPDLRLLDKGAAGDEWFIDRFQHGAVRDGKVYMPAFGPVLGQKAAWAIRSYLDTVKTDNP